MNVKDPLAEKKRLASCALEFERGKEMMASVSHRIVEMNRVVGCEVTHLKLYQRVMTQRAGALTVGRDMR